MKKNLTSYTLVRRSFLEKVAELTFEHTVGVFSLLFFAKLSTILREFSSSVGAVLARSVVLTCKNFIFTEDCFAQFAGNFRFWTGISSHFLNN